MAYWCDDAALGLEQRRRDAEQREAAKRAGIHDCCGRDKELGHHALCAWHPDNRGWTQE